MKSIFVAAALIAAVAAAPAPTKRVNVPAPAAAGTKHIMPLYKGAAAVHQKRQESDPITYQGGPVLSGNVNVYNIYYGTWSASQASILNDLASGISGSSWFTDSEPTYHDNSGNTVAGPVSLAGSALVGAAHGTSLSDADLPTIVGEAIASQGWPTDAGAIYFINGGSDVTETSGFCSQYCGFHTNGQVNGADLKYAFIGNPSSCLAGCSPNNQQVSPNGDVGTDAMVSIWSHELVEAMSDPLGNAWYDDQGEENADKCAYTYGTTSTDGNGATINESFNGRNWLIQQNWNAQTRETLALSNFPSNLLESCHQ